MRKDRYGWIYQSQRHRSSQSNRGGAKYYRTLANGKANHGTTYIPLKRNMLHNN